MYSSKVNPRNFQISMKEINRATQNFSSTNSVDKFNKIYRGQLSESWGNHTVVIIKRRYLDIIYKTMGGLSEALKIATSFHHENIITFIGYCFEGDEIFKVQEYAINGSLHDYLGDKNKMRELTWAQRLKICIGAARGLKHLHDGRVIHREFSCHAILLYENLEAKITKFGNSAFVSENQPTIQDGTYSSKLDPLYKESEIYNLESDVYSYGLVLFEMLSGISCVSEKLMYYVRQYYDDDLLDKLIDPSIEDEIDNHSFRKFVEIAYKCVSLDIKDRPTMDGIIKTLEEVLEIQVSIFQNI
ncbi:probable receptor-like protein kinase At5g61350 [Rutidosis leptorrhynchoides]|uniref:probable receptor-like protein kinase At5g61350 n=1 Tax=Rutidosis leptorrhynchoides TaxID=125765 RepID=UPI003A992520